MVLLITQRDKKNEKLGWMSSLENTYVRFFEKKRFCVISPSNSSKSLSYVLKKLPITHIVLSGGNNISPVLYKGKNKFTDDCSAARDRTEKTILSFAINKKIPILGICRGLQFINVYFGGKLIQDIRELPGAGHFPGNKSHSVMIVDKSLGDILKKQKQKVNSFHNQGVNFDCLAKPLKAFAISDDNALIEGVYHQDLPIVGIQWHPERKGVSAQLNKALIDSFINHKLYWHRRR